VGGRVSVPLTRLPEPDPALVDPQLEEAMAFVRRVVRQGLAARGAAGLKVRQPLPRALVLAPPAMLPWLSEFEAAVLDELNVEAMDTAPTDPAVAQAPRTTASPTWTPEGKPPGT